MSALAPALLDSLRRLLPAPAGSRLDAAADLALQQVVMALSAALERGELALDLEGPVPESLAAAEGDPTAPTDPAWPADPPPPSAPRAGWWRPATSTPTRKHRWCAMAAGCVGAAGTSSWSTAPPP